MTDTIEGIMEQAFLPIADFDLKTLTEKAVITLQTFEPRDQPYYGAFSGGKDSVVIKKLAEMAGVNVVWHYNQTTIDPPELIRFIREYHPDVRWNKPPKGNFFHRMIVKGFPTRRTRWCCEEYKESVNPKGERLILGVRGAESKRRAKDWKVVTYHTRTRTHAISPILTWSDKHVWDFIKKHSVPYCSLYDEGFHRLGCIGCPMARKKSREKEFARWPKFEKLWKRAFKRIWERRAGSKQRDGREWFGSAKFNNWEQMWEWWLSDDPLPGEQDDCQGFLDLIV